MSHRSLVVDVQAERKARYEQMEKSGETQAALWEAMEELFESGAIGGPKLAKVMALRADIKNHVPK